MRIGPLTAIFIMNMIMIYKLNNLKLRKRYTRNRGLFSISRIVSDTETSTTTGIKSSNHIKKLTKEIKIGKVLVLISTTYLFFTLPHTIDLTIYMSLVSLDAGEGRGKRTNIMRDCFIAKMLTFFFLTLKPSLISVTDLYYLPWGGRKVYSLSRFASGTFHVIVVVLLQGFSTLTRTTTSSATCCGPATTPSTSISTAWSTRISEKYQSTSSRNTSNFQMLDVIVQLVWINVKCLLDVFVQLWLKLIRFPVSHPTT